MDDMLMLFVLSEDGVTAGIVGLPGDDENDVRGRCQSAAMFAQQVGGFLCWDDGAPVLK